METNVGILGCGNVGAGVVKMLIEDKELLSRKMGRSINLVKVAVRDAKAPRLCSIPKGLLTTDHYKIVGNPGIQIVVELMGGVEPARTLILKAIEAGQHIVTANKALLATHGREIFEAAAKANVEVMFEPAVAGAIPIIRTLRVGLAGNRFNRLYGILNGTTNYILTCMTEEGLDFETTLKEAQKAGYAETDPTFDVEGIDAAHKLIILTALAYGVMPKLEDIHVEGISRLKPVDFMFAEELGYVIKLLAISSQTDTGLEVRLHPTMLPKRHLLSDIKGAMNAVHLNGHACGDILLYGAGAGMMPTASSVVGDIMAIARLDRQALREPPLGWSEIKYKAPKPMAEVKTSYYLRFTVADRPGVLSAISGIFGRYNISLAQVIQKAPAEKDLGVPLVMLTHLAQEKAMKDALKEIGDLDALLAPVMLIRQEHI